MAAAGSTTSVSSMFIEINYWLILITGLSYYKDYTFMDLELLHRRSACTTIARKVDPSVYFVRGTGASVTCAALLHESPSFQVQAGLTVEFSQNWYRRDLKSTWNLLHTRSIDIWQSAWKISLEGLMVKDGFPRWWVPVKLKFRTCHIWHIDDVIWPQVAFQNVNSGLWMNFFSPHYQNVFL